MIYDISLWLRNAILLAKFLWHRLKSIVVNDNIVAKYIFIRIKSRNTRRCTLSYWKNIYVYIYIERERERDLPTSGISRKQNCHAMDSYLFFSSWLYMYWHKQLYSKRRLKCHLLREYMQMPAWVFPEWEWDLWKK